MCLNQLKYILLNKKSSKMFYNLLWKIPFQWAILKIIFQNKPHLQSRKKWAIFKIIFQNKPQLQSRKK